MKKFFYIIFIILFSCVVFNNTQEKSSVITKEKTENITFILESSVPKSDTLINNNVVDIFLKINQYRVENGLKELIYNDELAAAAQTRAVEISQSFSHIRPNGLEWYTVNESICYGEILAEYFTNTDLLIQAWIESPTHKACIVNSNFLYCGVGIYNNNYYVVEFCY